MRELTYEFIVINATENTVLLTPEGRLPTLQTTSTHIAVTEEINRFFKNEYDIDTHVLKCLEQNEDRRLYLVELLHKGNNRDLNWITLSAENLYPSPHIASLVNATNLSNVSWFHFGWRHATEQWYRSEIGEPSDIIQIRSWERSSLMKMSSTNQTFYLKAVPDVFKHEVHVTQYLSKEHPDIVPNVIKRTSNIYLLPELKGMLLGKTNDLSSWRQSLLHLAVIQKRSIQNVDALKQLSIPTRPIDKVIQHHYKSTLNQLKEDSRVSDEGYQELIKTGPKLLHNCEQIKKSHIPLALEHGDLFGGNIMVHEGEVMIFDWSDSTLSHPFLSTIVLLEEIEDRFSVKDAVNIRDLYLEQWIPYGTSDELVKEWEYIQLLAPIYYLTIYETYIFPSFEDNFDREQIIQHYIQKWIDNMVSTNE